MTLSDAAADVLDSVRTLCGATPERLADDTGRDPEEVTAALSELQEAGEVYRSTHRWYDHRHAPTSPTEGGALRAWRCARGWSQERVAIALGWAPASGQASVSQYERGLPVSRRVQDALRGLVSR